MNKHLKPVFKILLPELEKVGIDYWVFGGVSIASYAQRFIRRNKDVDVFVRYTDFDRVKSVLEMSCHHNQFHLKYFPPKNSNSKPKIDVMINGDEIMSVIPVYQKNNVIEFKYPKGNEKYSVQILEKVRRKISDYECFTPPDEFIKEIFINHMKARPDKKKRKNFQIDAKEILNQDELTMLSWRLTI
jgi:hypothetical protein